MLDVLLTLHALPQSFIRVIKKLNLIILEN